MPLYEYQCRDCGNRFEKIEKASAMHDGECPACGGAARRLLGAPALQFKGSGWYVNDYGKGNGSPPPASEKTAEKASESASDSSSKTSTKSDTSTSSKSSSDTSSKVA